MHAGSATPPCGPKLAGTHSALRLRSEQTHDKGVARACNLGYVGAGGGASLAGEEGGSTAWEPVRRSMRNAV